MIPRRLVREPKRMTRIWEWSQGAVPAGRFPIFKSRYPINPNWQWRSAALRSDQHEFRLLVQMRMDKPNQKAWLAVKMTDGWAMVARLESHAHHGLHCHAECGESLTIGEIDPSGMRSIPDWRAVHRRSHEVKSQQEWWEYALRFFRAQAAERGPLL